MKIIIIDDDPTGSQTVHDCFLLLNWDYETLLKGFQSKSNLLFILANTRALSENKAKKRIQEISYSLMTFFDKEGYKKSDFIFVSRGDSTLRGHNFMEPNEINLILGPFDATFHIPAFIEGKRITINGRHFINDKPAHMTIYAEDIIYGYETNNIKQLLHDKSNNKLGLDDIKNLDLSELSQLDIIENNKVYNKLRNLKNNTQVIVDSENYTNLKKFASAVQNLYLQKNFLFRTAASFITVISNSANNSKDKNFYSNLRRKNKKNKFLPGLIIVGSYIEITTIQLEQILLRDECKAVELDVVKFYTIYKSKDKQKKLFSFKQDLLTKIKSYLGDLFTPVLYTSRKFISLQDNNEQIAFYNSLSLFIAEIVADVKNQIAYLISKGGITSNIILSNGFNADYVYLEGQILQGISLVTLSLSNINETIPVVTFPGNIGEKDTLVEVWSILENKIFK